MRAVERPDSLIKPIRKINYIVKTLLNEGADPNIQDNEGYSALMWAVHWGNKDAIELLVEHGADMSLKNDEGESAHSIADSNGDKDMVEFLHQIRAKN